MNSEYKHYFKHQLSAVFFIRWYLITESELYINWGSEDSLSAPTSLVQVEEVEENIRELRSFLVKLNFVKLKSFVWIKRSIKWQPQTENCKHRGARFPAFRRKTQLGTHAISSWLILQIHALRRCVLCRNAITYVLCEFPLKVRRYCKQYIIEFYRT